MYLYLEFIWPLGQELCSRTGLLWAVLWEQPGAGSVLGGTGVKSRWEEPTVKKQ